MASGYCVSVAFIHTWPCCFGDTGKSRPLKIKRTRIDLLGEVGRVPGDRCFEVVRDLKIVGAVGVGSSRERD